MKDVMRKLLFVDDLALVANDNQVLQETLDEWNGLVLVFFYQKRA